MTAEFLKAIKETLALEKPVSMEDRFREYEIWDSLSYLVLNLMLEELYGVEITNEEFKEMDTINDIYIYVTNHSGIN